MKIIGLTNYLSARGGGIPPAILPLYSLLASQPGVEVVLVAGDRPDQEVTMRVVTYRRVGSMSFALSPDLLSILDHESPDIVHLHGLWTYSSLAVQIWGRRNKKPIVVSPHGMVDPWALRHGALKKKIVGAMYEWSNLRNASYIHALSEGEVIALNELGFRERVIKIPNGVDVAKNGHYRESSSKTLLYLGRLHPKKGLRETLIAWSIFQKDISIGPGQWQLVIAGWDDGGHLEELHKIVTKYQLDQHVKFVGPVFGSAKETLYATADATILASHSEGLPMTVLETWASGRPVFMTEHCNLNEGFQAGAAFRITTDPNDIARTLIDVLPDQARLTSAGKAARALAESSFDWTKIAKTWFDLYSSLVRDTVPAQP